MIHTEEIRYCFGVMVVRDVQSGIVCIALYSFPQLHNPPPPPNPQIIPKSGSDE